MLGVYFVLYLVLQIEYTNSLIPNKMLLSFLADICGRNTIVKTIKKISIYKFSKYGQKLKTSLMRKI